VVHKSRVNYVRRHILLGARHAASLFAYHVILNMGTLKQIKIL